MVTPAVTTGAVITCPHPPGAVSVTGSVSTALITDGRAVFNTSDIVSQTTVASCTNTNPGPCTAVVVASGWSSALKKDGNWAVLTTTVLNTNQGYPLVISETQTALKG